MSIPSWSLIIIIINLFFLIILCQLTASSSKVNNRALNIVKSIDDYLCQNYVFTCFYRGRYHQSFEQQEIDNCKPLLILYSCLHYNIDLIRMCPQFVLRQTKENLANETPTYCFTSSLYKTFYTQHLRSIALPRTTIHCQIFIFFYFLSRLLIE